MRIPLLNIMVYYNVWQSDVSVVMKREKAMKIIRSLLFILLAVAFFPTEAQTYRVLPLGNSLTQGWMTSTFPANADRVGYRYQFFDDLDTEGFSIDMVGHRDAGSGIFSESQHCGIPDTRDQWILRLLQDGYDFRNSTQITPGGEPYLDIYPADIILLHIGTNDILNGEGISVASVSDILDEIDAWESANDAMVIVFVAKIINTSPSNLQIALFNNNLETMVTGRGDPNVILVDMATDAGLVPADYYLDGIHLVQTGYDKMGGVWSSAVSNYLNSTPADPSNLSFTGITASSLTLNWNDNSGNETGFEIYRSLNSLFGYSLVTTTAPGAESYQDNGLNDNTQYFYRIRATGTGGNSPYLTGDATTLLAAPAAPSGLGFTDITNSSIRLSWTDNSDNEAGFEILRSTSSGGPYSSVATVTAGVTTYNNTGLNDNTQYFYRVSAYNIGGSSSYISGNATTLPNPPSTPSNLAFADVTTNSIRLNWRDRSNNEDGFEIRRSTSPGGPFLQVATVGANVETYNDVGLTGNTRYYYQLYAYNTGGYSGFDEGNEITLMNAPDAPTNLTFSNITESSIRLNWTDNSNNESGFEIRRALSSGGTYNLITTTVPNAVLYTDNGLEDNTQYFYRVNAINDGGASSFVSGSATTLLAPPVAPSLPQATATNVCTVQLTWQDNSDNETGFRIERSPNLNSGYLEIGTVGPNVESFTDNSTQNNGAYYYRIRAYNDAGNSVYSPSAYILVDIVLQGGVIGSDQSICVGGDPELIRNVIAPSGGSGNWTYQWQSRVSTGVFEDVPGATAISYNPPAGLMETSEFIRISTVECGSVGSNSVTISAEDLEAPQFTSCPVDLEVAIERNLTGAEVITPDPVATDNCGLDLLTWALTGATSGNSPATGINYLGTFTFNLGTTTVTYTAEDLSGNTSECSFDVLVELLPPEVTGVSIPNVIMGIGDVVQTTITVLNDGGDPYTLVSGSVGGYPLTGLLRQNATTYVATFEITEGGNSYLALQNIPVANLVVSDGSVQSVPFTDPIVQNADQLDAALPVINTMSAVGGVYGIGDAVLVNINADGTGYSLLQSSAINGIPATADNVIFTEIGAGNYRISYIVAEGDQDVDPGELTASVVLVKPSGNQNLPYDNLLNTGLVTIDANAPVVDLMEVSDEEVGVGGTVRVSVTADGETYLAVAGTVINGIPLSSPRVSFAEVGSGVYELSYVVAEEDTDVDPGTLSVQLVLEDPAGNNNLPYDILEPNDLEVYTQLPAALMAGTPEICEGEMAELSIFLEGRGPLSFDLFDGSTTTTYEDITLETLILAVSPSVTTSYSITQVRDVNGVVNTGSGSVPVRVNPVAEVEIIGLKPAYNVQADPVQLQANIPGGTFSGPGVFSGGIFDPGVADTVNSPHTLWYTYENANGCVSTDSALVYVIGAQGAIVIPSDLICSDIGPFQVTAYNAADATGSFRLLDATGQTVNGLTDNGDNTATVDPGLLSDGVYTIDYQYVDQVVLRIRRSFTVESVTAPVITNLDQESYCQNTEPFILESDQPDAIFEGPGVTLTEDGYLFNPVDVTPGEIIIECRLISAGGCEATSQQLVTIDFAPKADFTLSATCIDEAGGTVNFNNLTPNKLLVESWSWDFGDPESGDENQSSLVSPEHYYAGPGEHTISLTAKAGSGCVSVREMTVDLGNRPVADFTWSSDCYREDAGIDFMNRSVSESNPFDTLVWRFRTAAGVLIGEVGYSTGSDTLNYQFPELANYEVELYAMNAVGCADSVKQEIRLRETLQLQAPEYLETFDMNDGKWTVESDDQVTSWTWEVPDFTGFSQVQGDRAWFTQLPEDVNNYKEQSWVQSPCFDFSGMKRPMIQMDIMRSFVPTRDGAVLQYQASKEEGWKTVGEPGSGIEWYGNMALTNKPGGNDYGWSLDLFNPDDAWVRAVHGLDAVAGEPSVTFRVAIGTGSNEPGYGNQGFAFDNVSIGERTKLVLLEHFTNSSDITSRAADNVVDGIAAEERGNLVDLQYHMSYPGSDPMNENNPDPPVIRSFNLSVFSVPYAVVDGGISDEYRFDFSDLKATPSQDHIGQLSLKAPLFDIQLDVNWMEGALKSTATVTCKTDNYDGNIQLYVAVMETSVTEYTGLNGDQEFRNVVLDMLPDATGVLLGNNWRMDDSVSQVNNWNYQPYVEDAEELAVVAFVQDRNTKEILQAAASYRSPQVGIGDALYNMETLQLYPNPGKSLIHVNLGRDAREAGRLVIIDMNGRVVRQQLVPAGYQIHQLDISTLDRGLYMVQWYEGQQLRARGKLMKVE